MELVFSNYNEDSTFQKAVASNQNFKNLEFDNCTFTEIDFSNSEFISCKFNECTFSNCNLSSIQLNNSQLNDVSFVDCKVLGVHFEECSDFLFSVSFDACNLDYCTFYKKKLVQTTISNSSLKQVDFSEADLSKSSFNNSNLFETLFYRTNLTEADFRTAQNFSIHPLENQLKKAKFSRENLEGLLEKFQLKIY
jgi:uncharacterized protein YjbI with pentapeptide repeats